MKNEKPKKPAPQGRKESWLRAFARGLENGNLVQELRLWYIKDTQAATPKKQTYLNKRDGPMLWLGDQIVKRMEKAGYPAKIHCGYRSPKEQDAAYLRGASRAQAWQSPHQFYEAVDIIHKTRGWNVSQDFWDTLAAVVRVVEREYDIDLEHGYDWGWDSAHIEVKEWRDVRDRQLRLSEDQRVPTPDMLERRFDELLPSVRHSQQ